uniref:Uncharacterized protein n=1 Tax=Rhizophora mucronata TaxID=61149 RepID=A0A2P2PUD1_RHIMU
MQFNRYIGHERLTVKRKKELPMLLWSNRINPQREVNQLRKWWHESNNCTGNNLNKEYR